MQCTKNMKFQSMKIVELKLQGMYILYRTTRLSANQETKSFVALNKLRIGILSILKS